MERNRISQEIINIVEDHLCPEQKVEEIDDFEKDLNCDSLDMLEINMKVEEYFNISIPEEILVSFTYVKDMVNYVDANI